MKSLANLFYLESAINNAILITLIATIKNWLIN